MIRGGRITLNVTDVGQAVRFYVETLGMKLVEEHTDGSAVIDAGDGFLVGFRQGAVATGGVAITFYTKVPLVEAIAIYENRGVVFELGRAGERAFATFRDPASNVLVLAEA